MRAIPASSNKLNGKKQPGHYLKEQMGLLIEENGQTALLWCSGPCEGPRLKGSAQYLPSPHSTDSVTGNSWMKFTESILEATK